MKEVLLVAVPTAVNGWKFSEEFGCAKFESREEFFKAFDRYIGEHLNECEKAGFVCDDFFWMDMDLLVDDLNHNGGLPADHWWCYVIIG